MRKDRDATKNSKEMRKGKVGGREKKERSDRSESVREREMRNDVAGNREEGATWPRALSLLSLYRSY